jgi:hypothetical protein
MLWNIGHPFNSIIEAGPDFASARSEMIKELREHPERFITKITPAEPSAKTLVDVVKRVVGM